MRKFNPFAFVLTLVGVMAALVVLGALTPTEAGFDIAMAMAVQTAYTENQRAALEGMVATMNEWDADTGICEVEAGIPFGRALGQGTADKGVVLGGTLANFRGVSIRDITLAGESGDKYPNTSNVGKLRKGRIWVKPSVEVAAGDPVHYDATTGVFTNTGGTGPIVGAKYETSAGANELARIYLPD